MTDTDTANSLLVDGLDNLGRYLALQREAIHQLARELILRSPDHATLDVALPIAHDLARLGHDSQLISDQTRQMVSAVTQAKFERLVGDGSDYGHG